MKSQDIQECVRLGAKGWGRTNSYTFQALRSDNVRREGLAPGNSPIAPVQVWMNICTGCRVAERCVLSVCREDAMRILPRDVRD
jgi:hypothetical protein